MLEKSFGLLFFLKQSKNNAKRDRYIARHTFAITITLANGASIEAVSKMLGHKSLKQTQHYAKILDTKISFDMKALREKLQ